MSPERDAGQLSVDALVAEGVTHVFGLGGGHINPTWWAAPGAGLRIIDVRHEAAAVYAAHGWALATGEPGVCLVTAGPGVTNAVTGLATALHDGVPLVCLAGAATSRGEDLGEVEYLDQLEVVQPVTKWARRVQHLERIPETIARAFTAATSGRPGPTYVEIAIDLAHARVDTARVRAAGPSQWRERRAIGPPDELVTGAADADPPRTTAGDRGGQRCVVVARRCRGTPGLRRRDRNARGHPPGRARHRARRPSALHGARLAAGRGAGRRAARGREPHELLLRVRRVRSSRLAHPGRHRPRGARPFRPRPRSGRRRRRGSVPASADRRCSARSTSATGVPACGRSATRSPRPRRASRRRTRPRCTRCASAPKSPGAFPMAPP